MDDGLLILLALLFLLLQVGALLGWIAFLRTQSLRREVAQLRRLMARSTTPEPMAVDAVAPAPESSPTRADAAPASPTAAGPSEPSEPVGPAEAAAPGPQPDEAPRSPASGSGDRPKPSRGLEESFGTRWAVWVGGLALALGAVFLVRYSIEAGLLGPAARIAMGLAFAGLLLAAGEWLRRSGLAETDDEALRRAYVPGVLTAAGIVGAFAAAYAAYALYGFLGDLAAFLVLAALSLATLALALLHGPAIAALGLVPSYATPILVASQEPSYWALSLYLLLITAATLILGRIRRWRWLAISAVVGTVVWALGMTLASLFTISNGPIIGGFLVAAFALSVSVFVVGLHRLDPADHRTPADRVAVAVLSLFALPVLLHLGVFGTSPVGVALMVAYGTATAAIAYGHPPLRGLVPAGILVLLAGYAAFDGPLAYTIIDPATGEAVTPDVSTLLAEFNQSGRLFGTAALLGLMFGGLGLYLLLGSAARVPLAAMATAVPLGLLVLAYLRVAEFEANFAFAAGALALAGWFSVVTEALIRRLDRREFGADGAVAVFAVAAVMALGAAFSIALEKGALTIAIALMVPAMAWVEVVRPVAGLRPLAVAAAVIVALRVFDDPRIVGDDLGTTPVFNWLLYGYGVPAAAFGYAAWRFGRSRMDRHVPILESFAVVFTLLTLIMVIHHALNGGDLFGAVSGLAEQSLIVSAMLAVSLGMQWIAVRRPGLVFGKGALLVGAVGLVLAGYSLTGLHNPLFSGEWIEGGPFDGTLAVGFLPPAVLAGLIAGLARRRADRPIWYVRLAGWLAGILVFLWATAAVRAGWHSGNLVWPDVEEGELYAYSAVWLLLGLVTLGFGVVTASRPVRAVAALLVLLVVVKVFLIDSAGLTGALRALSFIGLGLVLVVVGLAYQKLLRRQRNS